MKGTRVHSQSPRMQRDTLVGERRRYHGYLKIRPGYLGDYKVGHNQHNNSHTPLFTRRERGVYPEKFSNATTTKDPAPCS